MKAVEVMQTDVSFQELRSAMKKLSTLIPLLLWLAVFTGPSLAQNRGYTVQTASRQSEAEARAEMAKLVAAGLPAHIVRATVKDKGIWFRVRYGRFNTLAEAQLSAEQAHTRGVVSDYIVTLYETPMPNPATRNETAATSETKTATKPSAKAPSPTDPGKPDAPKEPLPKVAVNKEPSKEVAKEAESKPAAKPTGGKTTDSGQKTAPAPGTNQQAITNQPPAASETPVKPANELAVKSNPVEPEAAPKTESVTSPAPTANNETDNEAASNHNKAAGKATNKEAAPEKVSPVPRIAQPPVPDVLGELDINNRNWKVVRRSNGSTSVTLTSGRAMATTRPARSMPRSARMAMAGSRSVPPSSSTATAITVPTPSPCWAYPMPPGWNACCWKRYGRGGPARHPRARPDRHLLHTPDGWNFCELRRARFRYIVLIVNHYIAIRRHAIHTPICALFLRAHHLRAARPTALTDNVKERPQSGCAALAIMTASGRVGKCEQQALQRLSEI